MLKPSDAVVSAVFWQLSLESPDIIGEDRNIRRLDSFYFFSPRSLSDYNNFGEMGHDSGALWTVPC